MGRIGEEKEEGARNPRDLICSQRLHVNPKLAFYGSILEGYMAKSLPPNSCLTILGVVLTRVLRGLH